ncbi:MAG: DUF3857 domain-containing protein [Woeseiaceae bacterium]|nr:DUF3857 domain-containing protein [Woeseiaceae bacterium]
MRFRVTNIAPGVCLALALSFSTVAGADANYADKAGSLAGFFINAPEGFALDLSKTPYVIVDFTEQLPDANFAAMRFDPLMFSMSIVEELGTEMTPRQYTDIVRTATRANLTNGNADAVLTSDVEILGKRRVDGVEAWQLGFSGELEGAEANYVITAFVNGTRAYQLTTFAAGQEPDVVRREADVLADAFSFMDVEDAVTVSQAKQVDRYRSDAFAYSLTTDEALWFPWADVGEDYEAADLGALGAKGYGVVIMPFCWQGSAPTQLALLDVFMAQFGEEYPSDFISSERPIEKDGARGLRLTGTDVADGETYLYEFWVASNEQCAYVVSAWGPARLDDTATDLEAFWAGLNILAGPTVFDDGVPTDAREKNAFFLNQLGMHYYEARSYRESFRFLAQAADLDRSYPTYLTNALRVLSEIDAYREAYDWLQPRLSQYGDNQIVRSWDAWLAYQVDESEKAVRIYESLFRDGYREDEEFEVYLELLANREEWDKLDSEFAAYAGDNLTDSLRRIKASLLSRRGRHDDALAILDAMTEGRPFNAELVYAKIEVYDAMDNASAILDAAELLIENNYESLESWFWKGYAEYGLKSYLKSRESFLAAQKFSPTSSIVNDYIASINGILGEGDNASISEAIAAARLPKDIAKLVSGADWGGTRDGYGAYFINRILGYEFDGGESVTETFVQQIKIQDAQGIEQFSTLEFDFDPAFEQLYVNRLLVRDADGEVVAEADRAAFYVTDTIDGYEASTEQTAHLPVPSLAPGVVIEVEVTKRVGVERGELPLDIHYLSSSRPIGYSAIFVTGDPGGYSFESFGVAEPRKSGRSMVWEMVDPVVYRWEPMQPYFDRMLPWVTLGSTSADWNRAGAEYYAKIEEKLDTSRVADAAGRLVRGAENDLEKVELIASYVQKELHYEAIEFGRRAYIPKTARETLRDRYGDCKDHAVLLYSMLQSVGVPAELALVNLNQRVLPALPNVDQFDHMIVAVPSGDSRLFIDTTDKDLNLGRLPPRFMAGNKALIITNEQSELVGIPDFEQGHSTLTVQREVERTDTGELRIIEIGTFSGFQAAELRGQLRDIEASEMLATMQRWVADRYADAIVDDAFVDHLFEAGSELVVELEYRLPVDDDSFKVPGFFEAEYLDYARVADRRFTFEMPAPFTVSAITTVRQPGGAKLAETASKPDADESAFGHWRRSIDKRDDSWVFSLEYSGRKSEYTAEQYGDFAEFHRRLIGSIEQPVTLQ